ncbi:hypothetical protein KEM48_006854 [Puccinia striiformis f. sp. tritici PST-130]|nr:hypothetical protein KEM48_006854 [Puccinia striiformis f. sp. tritici PST-130]
MSGKQNSSDHRISYQPGEMLSYAVNVEHHQESPGGNWHVIQRGLTCQLPPEDCQFLDAKSIFDLNHQFCRYRRPRHDAGPIMIFPSAPLKEEEKVEERKLSKRFLKKGGKEAITEIQSSLEIPAHERRRNPYQNSSPEKLIIGELVLRESL